MNWLHLLFLLVILSSCGGDNSSLEKNMGPVDVGEVSNSADRDKLGDLVVEGSIGDASNLIPILASDSVSHSIASLVYNGLLKYNKNLELVGDLAEKWEIASDESGGSIITFYLRKNVRWHDGKLFTADDVVFTYNVIVDDKTPTAYDGDFLQIDHIDKIDDYTVKVYYEKPYAPALSSWTMYMLPKHLLDDIEITSSNLQRSPIGTGAFKFKEWKNGESINLSFNSKYFEGRPLLNGYIYRIIPDSTTMFLELLSEKIDFMSMSPIQFSKQTDNPRFRKQFSKYTYLSNNYTYIAYNTKNPLFSDKRVRQALTYATPKDEIIQGVLFGLGTKATGPYKPDTLWHNKEVKTYPYDLAKAKELLRQAGFVDEDGNGILEKGKKEFKFTIITNQGNSTRAKVAEILQERWGQLGIKVEIRVLEWATFLNEYIDKRNFDAVLLAWSIPLEPDLFDVWHSSKCEGKNLNFICYQNSEVDRLIEKGRSTLDEKIRKNTYFKIQEILAEDQPYTFLYVPMSLVGLNKRFEGVEPAPAGIMHNIIKWHVKEDNQKYHFIP